MNRRDFFRASAVAAPLVFAPKFGRWFAEPKRLIIAPATDYRIVSAADIYVGDFGRLAMVGNPMRESDFYKIALFPSKAPKPRGGWGDLASIKFPTRVST